MRAEARCGTHIAATTVRTAILFLCGAPTRTMNPSVSQQVIDAATERDSASAAAEWLAEFRSDIESFIAREAVEACIAWGVRERPSLPNITYYRASAR